ncbi:MAG: cob(I)yrinic acid a,c-diamide adenosyltransferase [Nitrososphaerales archaeon]
MVKIYTKGGDKGDTSLIGGKRVPKSSVRINAYGNVDELNASIGIAISFIDDNEVKKLLEQIQNELFIVGSDLADPSYPESVNNSPRVNDALVKQMENIIDKYDQEVGAIQFFILPGGSKEAALLHLARGIARRAERNCVELSNVEKINPTIITYLNRLSDLLYTLARVMNKRRNVNDVAWQA